MPCTGPTPPPSEYVEKVFQEILELLKEKHKIDFKSNEWIGLPKPMLEFREKVFTEFKAALKELLYQDSCETW